MKRLRWCGLLVLALCAAAFTENEVDTPPDWLKKPTPEMVAEFWPKEAPRRGAAGAVTLSCGVTEQGALRDCQIVDEKPAGYNFGAAALAMAPQFIMKPALKDGRPAPFDDLRIPVFFIAPNDYDTPPDWLKKPTPEMLRAVWPTEALRLGLGGKATISCQVTIEGVLRACKVVSETPAGANFGAAAIAMAAQLLMKPAIKDGRPVPSDVRIPVVFHPFEVATGSHIPGGGIEWRQRLGDIPWRSAPSYRDMASVYPPKASAAGVNGRATLTCHVTEEGRLRFCRTLVEEPTGQGFGSAARSLASLFSAPPEISAVRDRGATTDVVFTFSPTLLSADPPKLGKPEWTARPADADFQAVLREMRAKGVPEVAVSLTCVVAPTGALADCRVERETPAGFDIGPSAIRLAGGFRHALWTTEGKPAVGSSLKLPLRFRLTEPAPAPKAKP